MYIQLILEFKKFFGKNLTVFAKNPSVGFFSGTPCIWFKKTKKHFRSFLNLTDVTGPLEDDTSSNQTSLIYTEDLKNHSANNFLELFVTTKGCETM